MISGHFPPRIVRIGNCHSGVLASPKHKVYRRMALATQKCFDELRTNQALHSQLRQEIESRGKVAAATLGNSGFKFTLFFGRKHWQTFGIYQESDASDFRSAYDRLTSLDSGIHRRVLLAIIGLQSTPAVETLSSHHYSSLLARIQRVYKDPNFEKIREIRITDKPLGIDSGTHEDKVITFSIRQLEAEPYYSCIRMENLTKG